MPFSDPYTLRARIAPALIVALPASLAIFALLPEIPLFVTAFSGILGAVGGTAILAQVGRERGRKKEPALWKSWDGPPTTRLLRHRRIPSDIELAVFAENANYGFRRNLWGLRSIGTPIAVVLSLFVWTQILLTVWGRPWPDPWWDVFVNPDNAVVIRLAVAITCTVLAVFWMFWVRSSWVKVVANAYAERLMESVETLRSG